MPAKKYKTVEEYFKDIPEERLPIVAQLRSAIREAIPEAEEVISYNMPAYKLKGILLYFGVAKQHIGFYPTPSAIEAFKDQLEGFQYAKGSIKFPFNKKIPLELVQKMAKFRLEENKNK